MWERYDRKFKINFYTTFSCVKIYFKFSGWPKGLTPLCGVTPLRGGPLGQPNSNTTTLRVVVLEFEEAPLPTGYACRATSGGEAELLVMIWTQHHFVVLAKIIHDTRLLF